jgi:hypothetical protein
MAGDWSVTLANGAFSRIARNGLRRVFAPLSVRESGSWWISWRQRYGFAEKKQVLYDNRG